MGRKVLAAVVLTGLAIGLVWTHAALSGDKKGMAPYVHTVIFYLKKDPPKDAIDSAIADAHKMLAKIPSVRGLWIGKPAVKATPKFAAKDYDIGLLVLFDNYDGLQEYLDHKLHTQFVEKHGKNFEKVTVFDFMNQK
jgi:hypothetical protein